MREITSKIKSVEVLKTEEINIQQVNEKMKRPQTLSGKTYRLKTPLSEFAWYITINDIVLNEGTENEIKQPFEVFINTKDVSAYQWVTVVSRLLSAVFRKGGDIKFILEEMSSVYQPSGGYISRKGYVPSIVAEIGMVVEEHFKSVGLIESETVVSHVDVKETVTQKPDSGSNTASICPACHQKTYEKSEGCGMCTTCGHSACG